LSAKDAKDAIFCGSILLTITRGKHWSLFADQARSKHYRAAVGVKWLWESRREQFCCHHAGPRRQRDCLTEGISPTSPPACWSRSGRGIPFFAPSAGIGMRQRWVKVEFSLGHSNRVRLRGDLAEDLIWITVQFSGVSGNIAFKTLILGFDAGQELCLNQGQVCNDQGGL